MSDTNGRLKLRWDQIIWGLTVVFILGGQFMVLRNLSIQVQQLSAKVENAVYTKDTIDAMRELAAVEHNGLQDQIDELWRRLNGGPKTR